MKVARPRQIDGIWTYDIVAAVFHFTGVHRIVLNNEQIDRSFYAARKFSSLINKFNWYQGALGPRSMDLDDAIAMIKSARIIICDGYLENYFIYRRAHEEVERKILPKLNYRQIAELKLAGQVLRDGCAADDQTEL